jgi:amyloid beta precursor protein binding protein 1
LAKWKDNHDKAPSTYDEKEEFRALVKSMANDFNNELNFQEAYDQAHLAWAESTISDESQIVLGQCSEEEFYAAAIETDMETDSSGNKTVNGAVLQFQLMVYALKRFLKENNNVPPLEGTIPDMASDTKTFVALQEAYRAQAESDRSKLASHISDILDACKAKSNGCKVCVDMPSEDDIVTFCKNARDINILETRPLYAEYHAQDPSGPVVTALSKSLNLTTSSLPNFDSLQSDARDDLICSTMDPYETDPMQTPLLWFIALRACDAFYDRHGHYPGKHDQSLALEADANEVYKLMGEIVSNMGLKECDFIKETLLNDEKGKNVAREVVRYDEAEIHTIAAVVGGVASQEAVKLITGQYVPVNDTFIYNGIASTASVHRF